VIYSRGDFFFGLDVDFFLGVVPDLELISVGSFNIGHQAPSLEVLVQ